MKLQKRKSRRFIFWMRSNAAFATLFCLLYIGLLGMGARPLPTGKGQKVLQERTSYQVTGKVSGIKNLKKTTAYVVAYKVKRGDAGQIASLDILSPEYQTVVNDKGEFSLKLYGDTEYQLRCIAPGYEPVPYPMEKKTVSEGQAIAITLDMQEGESYLLKALFLDEVTRKPLVGVKASLQGVNKGDVYGAYSDQNGICHFAVNEGELYALRGQKKKYFFNEADTFQIEAQKDPVVEKRFLLQEIKKGQVVRVKGFFDVNRHAITAKGAEELEKLYEIIKENPGVQFELSSHSDSRGDDHYNLMLSQKRAEAAVQYLVSKGISPTQLVPKGYGETFLLNQCANGVRCDADKHMENRRLELKVMGFLE